MISPVLTLCILLLAQGIQAWWYSGYGYGYHPPLWHYPAPIYHPVYHPPLYPHYYYHQHAGAQIGAAIGSLAAHLGKKK